MKHCVFFFLVFFTIFAGCKTTKKITIPKKNVFDLSKIDQAPNTIVDSFALAKQNLANAKSGLPVYTFFYAKVKLDYESADESFQATAYIRIQKDSIIWVSITGQLGIEGARILIRPDSLIVMNRINKTVLLKPASFLRDELHIPLDFYALQDLVTGNALFDDSIIMHYEIEGDTTQIILAAKKFQNVISINSKTNTIISNKLYDEDNSSLRSATFMYSGYEKSNGFNFSAEREIFMHNENETAIKLSFKQYSFNEIQTFPFNIPKNYSVK